MTRNQETMPASDPCGTCGACCRSFLVPVCGLDIWQICRAYRLYPDDFVVALPQRVPTREGFLLQAGESTYGLALQKQGKLRPGNSCIFLVEYAGGYSRCAVYPERPMICRTYPVVLRDGYPTVHTDALCPYEARGQFGLQSPDWVNSLQYRRMQFDIYASVIARWNERILEAPTRPPKKRNDFYDFLLSLYDQVAALDQSLGEKLTSQVIPAWERLADLPTGSGSEPGDLSACLEYRELVFETISSLF